ncbi:hypothetical protein ISS06_00645 [Patescibacteria group bacterium]|nr:hypothetical protein [Patescibacteria group bacterium]
MPIIIPEINSGKLDLFKKTNHSIKNISQAKSLLAPDSIIVLSSHLPIFNNAMALNLSEEYITNFAKFGNLKTTIKFKPAIELSHKIKEKFETDKIKLTMITQTNIDHQISIPLYYFDKNCPIVPISHSCLSPKDHYNFGKKLKQEILFTNKKIGIIASSNFFHGPKNNKDEVNKKLIKYIKKNQIHDFLEFLSKLIASNKEYMDLLSLCLLFGILYKTNYKTKILSYESMDNKGFLVTDFDIIN